MGDAIKRFTKEEMETPPDCYTQEEWDDLSPEMREGVLIDIAMSMSEEADEKGER